MADITKLVMRNFSRHTPIEIAVEDTVSREEYNRQCTKKVSPLTRRKIAYYSKKSINSLYENIIGILKDPSKY
ncbi:MAG: hypothetical protein AABW81_01595 [Nanoarchaeota archaeon]